MSAGGRPPPMKAGVIAEAPIFADVARLASRMKEVEVQIIPTEKEKVTCRWFKCGDESDIHLWEDERENLIKHQVVFYGQVVEWNVLDGVRTGLIIEEETGVRQVPSSESIHYDKKVHDGAVRTAIEILRHVTILEAGRREQLILHLTKPSAMADLSADEFVRRYGKTRKNTVVSRFRQLCQKLFS